MVVKYDLCCELGHEFEGWFPTEEDFAQQQDYGVVTCPICECAGVNRISAWATRLDMDCGDGAFSQEYQRTKTLLKEINEYVDFNLCEDNEPDQSALANHELRKSKDCSAEGLATIAVPFDSLIDKDKLN